MIGDLVYGCLEEEVVGEAKWKIPCEVIKINEIGDIHTRWLEPLPEDVDFEDGDDWSFLEPIPLTEEIIKKNFELNEPYQKQFGTDHLVYYVVPNPKWYSGIWNFAWVKGDNEDYLIIEDDPIIRIKYVHELQHLLKLCNINKEIEL